MTTPQRHSLVPRERESHARTHLSSPRSLAAAPSPSPRSGGSGALRETMDLDLSDPEVVDLVFEAAKSEECKVVGDDEFLHEYFAGPDFFHLPKTWKDGSA